MLSTEASFNSVQKLFFCKAAWRGGGQTPKLGVFFHKEVFRAVKERVLAKERRKKIQAMTHRCIVQREPSSLIFLKKTFPLSIIVAFRIPRMGLSVGHIVICFISLPYLNSTQEDFLVLAF